MQESPLFGPRFSMHGSTHSGVGGRQRVSHSAFAGCFHDFSVYVCRHYAGAITGAFAERVRFSPRKIPGQAEHPGAASGSLSSAHEHMLDGFTEVADAVGLLIYLAMPRRIPSTWIFSATACNDGFRPGRWRTIAQYVSSPFMPGPMIVRRDTSTEWLFT